MGNICPCFFSAQEEEYISWRINLITLLKRKYSKFEWHNGIIQILQEEDINIHQQSELEQQLLQDISSIQQGTDIHDGYSLKEYSVQFKEQSNQYSSNEIQVVHMKTNSISQLQEEFVSVNWNQTKQDPVPYRANSIINETELKANHLEKTYKHVISKFENHLVENQNPLNWIIQRYLLYFRDYQIEKTNLVKVTESSLRSNTRKRRYSKKVHQVIDDIKAFTNFFLQAMSLYYKFPLIFDQELLNCFNSENLTLVILTLLFRNDKFYYYLYSQMDLLYQQETETYFEKVQKFQNEQPRFFGVPEHLELIDENINFNETFPQLENQDEFQVLNTRKEESVSNQIYDPYSLAIQQFSLLSHVRSPVHQLKIIAKIPEYIQKSINEFYQRHGLKYVKNFGADELIPILIYIIVKSEIKDLGIYLKIMENFTPKNTLNSQAGYMLITLENCFNIIQNQFDDERNNLKIFSQSSYWNISYSNSSLPNESQIRNQSIKL